MYCKKYVIEKEQKKLERKLTNEFFNKKKFTKFEKETVKLLIGSFYFCQNCFHDAFYQDLKDNEENIDEIINKLDEQSGSTVKEFVENIKYLSTHPYIDLIQDLFNKEEELMEFIEKVNTYQQLKLHANLYEESVFGYHHGLVYLPNERIKSLINKDFLDCGAFIGDSALIFEKY